MTKPFTPEQAKQHSATAAGTTVDPILIEVINYLLACNPKHCRITDDDMKKVNRLGISRVEEMKTQRGLGALEVDDLIRDVGYKNITTLYNANGWNAKYEYPSYDESFKSYMIFTPR